ncbi:MAG: hypothetical protein ACJASQ_002346 [Crocinitomicaceae bacterium]|jgi:hypothetical protein
MKLTLTILILLLITGACSEDKQLPANNVHDKKHDIHEEPVNEEIQEEELSLHELFSQINHETPIKKIEFEKTDSSFTLPLEVGSKTFQNYNVDYPDGVKFEFHGVNQYNGFYIVEGHYWEWHEFYLVDKKTGITDTIWTKPLFSPNNNLIISKSVNWGLAETPNGYQIWEITPNHKWRKIVEIDQQDWVPLEFKWISNDAFILKKAKVLDYAENPSNIDSFAIFEKITLKR